MDGNSRTESIAVSAWMRKVQSLPGFKETSSKCSNVIHFCHNFDCTSFTINNRWYIYPEIWSLLKLVHWYLNKCDATILEIPFICSMLQNIRRFIYLNNSGFGQLDPKKWRKAKQSTIMIYAMPHISTKIFQPLVSFLFIDFLICLSRKFRTSSVDLTLT